VMVIGGGKRAIVDHFDRSRELEYYLEQRAKHDLIEILHEVDALTDRLELLYIQQKEPLGLGHAVWTARRHVEGEACAVLLPDDVILGPQPCLRQLIDAHLRTGATVLAARRVPMEHVNRYGIISSGSKAMGLYEVDDVVEKPDPDRAPSDLAIVGRYVLTPAVFDALEGMEPGVGQEIQLTDAIKRSIRGNRVVALEFEGDYYDTGTIPAYLKANLALALTREDLRHELLEVMREMVGASEAGLEAGGHSTFPAV
jgi:UTP--glucose-1-phosphate uridylyltransferase